MTSLSFKERIARLGRTRPVDRVSSGSPATVALRPGSDIRATLTISATLALVKRHATILNAKLAVEQALETGRSVLALPMLEDPRALTDEIAAAGMRVAVMVPEDDVKAVREGLGLTLDQFAIRYGLDAETVAAWEDGRKAPDRAVRSYLKVIRHLPLAASEALEDAPA